MSATATHAFAFGTNAFERLEAASSGGDGGDGGGARRLRFDAPTVAAVPAAATPVVSSLLHSATHGHSGAPYDQFMEFGTGRGYLGHAAASSGGGGASAAAPHRKPEPSLTLAEVAAALSEPSLTPAEIAAVFSEPSQNGNNRYVGTSDFHADARARRS